MNAKNESLIFFSSDFENKTEDPSVPDAWIIYKKGHVRPLKEPSLTVPVNEC